MTSSLLNNIVCGRCIHLAPLAAGSMAWTEDAAPFFPGDEEPGPRAQDQLQNLPWTTGDVISISGSYPEQVQIAGPRPRVTAAAAVAPGEKERLGGERGIYQERYP